jgi:hypothetical protein
MGHFVYRGQKISLISLNLDFLFALISLKSKCYILPWWFSFLKWFRGTIWTIEPINWYWYLVFVWPSSGWHEWLHNICWTFNRLLEQEKNKHTYSASTVPVGNYSCLSWKDWEILFHLPLPYVDCLSLSLSFNKIQREQGRERYQIHISGNPSKTRGPIRVLSMVNLGVGRVTKMLSLSLSRSMKKMQKEWINHCASIFVPLFRFPVTTT